MYFTKKGLELLIIWKNIENHMLMNQVKYKNIGVMLRIQLQNLPFFLMAKLLMDQNELPILWRHKILQGLVINLIILKKANMHLIKGSH